MSHFSKNTKVFITNLDAFAAACKELGINGKVTMDTSIRMFDGSMHKVDLAVKVGNYDIGLQREEEGRYSMVGDWWGIRQGLPTRFQSLSDEEQQNLVLKTTTKCAIVSQYEGQGFNCEVVEDKTGAMDITLTRDGGRY
jgi:hypothetical protein